MMSAIALLALASLLVFWSKQRDVLVYEVRDDETVLPHSLPDQLVEKRKARLRASSHIHGARCVPHRPWLEMHAQPDERRDARSPQPVTAMPWHDF